MKTFISVQCTPHRTVNIEVVESSAIDILKELFDCPAPVSIIVREGKSESIIDNFFDFSIVLLTVL